MPRYEKVVIVGPGLIGGSIGAGLLERGLCERVVGVVRSEGSGRRAMEAGVVHEATVDLPAAVSDAQLVVVCTPVGQAAEAIGTVASYLDPAAMITDAGSTKATIVQAAERELAKLDTPPGFVGSHPLAGDHRCGPESARPDLLDGRVVVVTPTPNTANATDRGVGEFWECLGARIVRMSPEAHDHAVAQTSHVPHVIATALAAATPSELAPLIGAGWRDTTRVAAGGAALWRDILLENAGPISEGLAQFEEALGRLREAVAQQDADAILKLLKQGKQARDALGS